MKKSIRVFLLLVSSPLLFFWGCTLLGYGIGHSIDKQKSEVVGGWEIVKLPLDQKITVYQHDLSKHPISGRYSGIVDYDTSSIDAPSGTLMLRHSGDNIIRIPVADISYIKTRTNRGEIIGTVVGLSVDVALAVALVNTADFDTFEPAATTGTSSTISSCPLIYSYDGTDYQLDAEIFGGAIFKAAERPDWDNLDHLQAHEGVYKLKMTSEFDETQQVDFVQLLAIDHLPGTQVYPSFKGELFTVGNLQEPRTAYDFYSRDVHKELRRDNDAYWLSNPFGRNLNDPTALRDGVVLEFDRSYGTSSAALVLNVQNTVWSSEAIKELLQLPGTELPAWYDELNSNPAARQQLVDFLLQEGMLQVSVWRESGWQAAGHIWAPGPVISKDIVVELDLLGFHSNTLKVKLECPPGMWIIHSAEVDYSYYNVPLDRHMLELQKATDQSGRDVSAVLQKADDRYHEMPTTQDIVYLEFPQTPDHPGMDRSFILRAGGYYTIHSPATGIPQMDLLLQMLNERGVFTRYMLEKLYLKTDDALQRVAATPVTQ
ncbi:MAG: hypothetical protein EP344_10955 [Bacteroidetes bacterium]|nr:MAG: hypothetical protein EP344_10955 [Bacteroidota bacterium]